MKKSIKKMMAIAEELGWYEEDSEICNDFGDLHEYRDISSYKTPKELYQEIYDWAWDFDADSECIQVIVDGYNGSVQDLLDSCKDAAKSIEDLRDAWRDYLYQQD